MTVLAWLILGVIATAFIFIPPATVMAYGEGYWEAWLSWNVLMWSAIIGSGLLAWAIVWSLAEIGVLG